MVCKSVAKPHCLICTIRSMHEEDIPNVAQVHAEAFPRQLFSEQWISCNFKAFPRIRYFVAECDSKILGYVQWTEKSGFRKEVVLELEQIAVRSAFQNRGIATQLITQSLQTIKKELHDREAILKHIIVTTRNDNSAQRLYTKTLNAFVETSIPQLFSGDEVIMIARNFTTS